MAYRKEKVTNRECKVCGKNFYVKPYFLKRGWGKYCSKKCQFQGQKNGEFVKCFSCGKKTWRTPKDFANSKSGKFFCSKRCQTLWRNKVYSGPNHPLWAGGITIYRKILLENGTKMVCEKCGEEDERLITVHHINGNRRNNDVKNLVWLCLNCHHLVHRHNERIN